MPKPSMQEQSGQQSGLARKGAQGLSISVTVTFLACHIACLQVMPQSGGTGSEGVQQSGGMLLVGPEGDWTPEELQMLAGAGARPVGLGRNRLRTETAAIALLAAATLM